MGTVTTNRLLNQPTVGGDVATWGTPLNTNATLLDQMLSSKATISFASAVADVSVTQSQMQNLCLSLTGTPSVTTVKAVLYQNMAGYWFVENLTPNPVSIITANVGSLGCTIAPGAITTIYSDGTNVVPWSNVPALRILTTGASTTLTVYDNLLVVNKALGSPTSVVMPAAGGRFTIKDGKNDAATNNITVSVASGGLIDGASTYIISRNGESADFVFNGTQYNRLSGAYPQSYWGGVASGTANALTATATGLKSYEPGLAVSLRTGTSPNTRAATININSLGVATVLKNGAALASGDLPANTNIMLVYDGTNFQMISGGTGTGSGSVSVSTATLHAAICSFLS